MKKTTRIVLLLISTLLFACSNVSPIMNQPSIAPTESDTVTVSDTDDDTLVILTFSGGGTRAAAFSYGVLKGLQAISLTDGNGKTLLDEVDVISGVSGGSFTAAYYGLFGKHIFRDYENAFLKRPVQSELINKWLLAPQNWNRLGSAVFNRSDLAAEYYDSNFFANKTFADMRADMPKIIINATDISTGALFSFTPENMRWICSDLASYPVSRAVAASSAVPGVFSPITLENYRGCEVNEQWKADKNIAKFLDKDNYPYLHLLDGGISDNLGIRGILRIIRQENYHLSQLLRKYGLNKVKNIAFIVVNASDEIPPGIAQSAEEPSAADTIGAVTTIQSRRYNHETLNRLNEQIVTWQKQQTQCKNKKRNTKTPCQAIQFHVIELDFEQLPKTLADEVSLYETSLELASDKVDTLISSGQYLLRNNAQFLTFLEAINASHPVVD